MGTSFERGFTVVELMLFLGISGALFAALMVGVSTSINQQRYRESVVSFSTLLQGQYSEVSNTRNDSSKDWVCGTNGLPQKDTGNGAAGTTKCVLLGKAIEVKNGTDISIYHVVGCEPKAVSASSAPPPASGSTDCTNNNTQDPNDVTDVGALKLYNPKLAKDFDLQTDTVEWSSTLQASYKGQSQASVSFLILRSPVSGIVRVFTYGSSLPSNLDLAPIVDSADATSQDLTLCVVGDSPLAAKQSVTINPHISGPEGIVAGDCT
jgi:type II secretory pathway pseudopilin PulG